MRISIQLITFLGLTAVTSGFSTAPVTSRFSSALASSTAEDATAVPLVISGNNIELTPALSEYVEKRIGGNLNKLTSNGALRECDVHLSVNKNPKVKNAHRVEVTTNLKGTTIHSKVESPDIYESIYGVAKALNRKLRKYKERRQAGFHGGSKTGDDLSAVLEAMESEPDWEAEAEEYEDTEKPVVTSVKSYDLSKPISLEEAVFALDYTDHDFYAFTNTATGAVNVVYKRKVGGIGHVEP